jgi:hypothetical protein
MEKTLQERRRFIRTAILKNARLFFGESSMVDCVVYDLAKGGVGIEVSDEIFLPRALDLTFDGGRSIRPCRRVWCNCSKAGLEFVST